MRARRGRKAPRGGAVFAALAAVCLALVCVLAFRGTGVPPLSAAADAQSAESRSEEGQVPAAVSAQASDARGDGHGDASAAAPENTSEGADSEGDEGSSPRLRYIGGDDAAQDGSHAGTLAYSDGVVGSPEELGVPATLERGSDAVNAESPSQPEPQEPFVMPEGVEADSSAVLVSLSEDVTMDDLRAAVAEVGGVRGIDASEQDLQAGFARLELEEGTSVEEAVNTLREMDQPLVEDAQPDYIYRLAHDWSPAYLRALCEPVLLSGEEARALKAAAEGDGKAEAAAGGSEVRAGSAASPADEAAGAAEQDTPSGARMTPVAGESAEAVRHAEGVETEAGAGASAAGEDAGAGGSSSGAVDAVSGDAGTGASGEAEAAEGESSEGNTAAVDAGAGGAAPAASGADSASTDASGEPGEATGAPAPAASGQDASSATAEGAAAQEPSQATEEGGAAALTEALAYAINDERSASQWALTSMRVYEAWSLARAEGGLTVAVIDNGVDATHVDLADNLCAGYNAALETSDSSPLTEGFSYYHGTHVAGIIAARANNGIGVAGVSFNAKVMPIQAFEVIEEDDGTRSVGAYSSSLTRAYTYILAHAAEHNVRVVNMSLGSVETRPPSQWTNSYDLAVLRQVRRAKDLGIVTVAAAGNSGTDIVLPCHHYPSDHEDVVGVINLNHSTSGSANDAAGAYRVARDGTSNYNVAGYGGTQTTEGKNISAPGTSILSTMAERGSSQASSGYGWLTGTSMASPNVAGVLALVFAANPSLTADEAIDILYRSAYDIGSSGWDEETGWGEANAYEAVRLALKANPENSLAQATITLEQDSYRYDGTEKRPRVTVKMGSEQLVEGADYELTYRDNVNAGTAAVIVSAIEGNAGGYVGSTEVAFTIEPLRIEEAEITLDQTSFVYGDASSGAVEMTVDDPDIGALWCHVPEVTVRYGGRELQQSFYGGELAWNERDYSVSASDFYGVGTASLVVKGVGNYGGSVTLSYRIDPCDMTRATLSVTPASFAYTGAVQRPKVAVKVGRAVQQEGSDYVCSVSPAASTDAGSYAVRVSAGTGNLTGTAVLSGSYRIERAAISSVSVPTSLAYTGSALTPAPVVKAGSLTVPASGYDVRYAANVSVGTATVTVTGKGNFSGSKSTTFAITAPSLANATVSLSATSFAYDGTAKTPAVTVRYGTRVLSAGTDYSVAYASNVSAGTARVTIMGKGNYTGSKVVSFQIQQATLGSITLAGSGWTYDGSAKRPQASVRSGSRVLREGTDYELAYANNVNAGTARVTATGKGNYRGSVSASFAIARASLAGAALSGLSAMTYTGSALTPKPVVRLGSTTLKEGTDYTTSYTNNVNVGTATVTVTGKGNYVGSQAASFAISAPSQAASSAAAATWVRLGGAGALDTMRLVLGVDGVFANGRGGTVVVASSDGYWDALSASGLAGRLDAPVVITPGAALASQARAEIERLKPSRVLVMGGPLAISDACVSQISALCPATSRVYGATALDTAVSIWRNGSGWGRTAIVATNAGYWDALSIAPYAHAKAAPIFLADSNRGLSASAMAALREGGFARVVITGGSLAVPASVESQARSAGVGEVVRLWGQNALDTSAAIARWEVSEGMTTTHLTVASSEGYWDALSAAAVCGKQNSVLVLAPRTGGYQAFDAACGLGAVSHGHVLGGTLAISEQSMSYFRAR